MYGLRETSDFLATDWMSFLPGTQGFVIYVEVYYCAIYKSNYWFF